MRNANELLTAFDSILCANFADSDADATARLKEFRGKLLQFRDEEDAARGKAVDPGACGDAKPPKMATIQPGDGAAWGLARIARPGESRFDQYRKVAAEHGPDSRQAANFIAAHADDPTFTGRVDALRKSHEGYLKYKAACEADARSDARSAFVGKVGRLAWGLVKFASIASAASYVGRLAWADLATRYFG